MGSEKKYISGECDLCRAYFTERSKLLDSEGVCKECLGRFILGDVKTTEKLQSNV